MPTMRELFEALQEQEDMEKTAKLKKQAIASPNAGKGDLTSNQGRAIEDAIGDNVAEAKVRIKKKLEEMAGAQAEAEGVASEQNEEALNVSLKPSGPALAPAATKAAAEDKTAEEKAAADEMAKIADEYYSAGLIMSRGFLDGLNAALSSEGQSE